MVHFRFPAIFINSPAAAYFKILNMVLTGGLCIGKGISQANTFQRLLFVPIDHCGQGEMRNVNSRRCNTVNVGVLGTNASFLYTVGVEKDQRIAGTALAVSIL